MPTRPWHAPRDRRALRVLVLSQRMDRTGAPIQLMALLPGLADALGARVTLLQGSTGPLSPLARPHVDRVRSEPWILRWISRIGRRAPNGVARQLERVWSAGMRMSSGRVDVVYVNSLISRRLALPFVGRPTVVHVHELGRLAESYGESAQALMRRASRILVPSHAAATWVIGCGVPAARVEILPGAVPSSALEPPSLESIHALRRELALADGEAVVSTVGWVGALKGSDRFLDVATRVREEHDEPVRFLWVGGGSTTAEEQWFRSEVTTRGLTELITILPAMEDLRPLYALSQIVLVASREESLSLVALESTAQGTPVVCFPGAGGPDDLADERIVIRPEQPDAGGVVQALIELLRSPNERIARGTEARDAVLVHHSTPAVLQQLSEVLDQVAGDGRARAPSDDPPLKR